MYHAAGRAASGNGGAMSLIPSRSFIDIYDPGLSRQCLEPKSLTRTARVPFGLQPCTYDQTSNPFIFINVSTVQGMSACV